MTATGKRHPEQRALAYVEGTLRVNEVYEDASAALDRMKAEQENMVRASSQKRTLHEAEEQREQELIAEQRALMPDASQAAFDRHMKGVLVKDDVLMEVRRNLRTLSDEYERAEASVRHEEFIIRVATARLEELAGRERYYAAVKMSVHTANDTDKTTGA